MQANKVQFSQLYKGSGLTLQNEGIICRGSKVKAPNYPFAPHQFHQTILLDTKLRGQNCYVEIEVLEPKIIPFKAGHFTKDPKLFEPSFRLGIIKFTQKQRYDFVKAKQQSKISRNFDKTVDPYGIQFPVGFAPSSYAYSSKYGHKYYTSQATPYGMPARPGDVVAMELIAERKDSYYLQFFINGDSQGIAFDQIPSMDDDNFIAVSLFQGASVRLNSFQLIKL